MATITHFYIIILLVTLVLDVIVLISHNRYFELNKIAEYASIIILIVTIVFVFCYMGYIK